MKSIILLALLSLASFCLAGPNYVVITTYPDSNCTEADPVGIEYVSVGTCLDNSTVSFNIPNRTFIWDFFSNDNCTGTAINTITESLDSCLAVYGTHTKITLQYELPHQPIPQVLTEAVWLNNPSCTRGTESIYTQVNPTCLPEANGGSSYFSCYHNNNVPYVVRCADGACKLNCTTTNVPVASCEKFEKGGETYYTSIYCSDTTPPAPMLSH
eukprot:TRINITY_DN20_c0_g1_i1.p1 TRINITY_DN20_c0_g1~~TRINITY_DN20_c0_g1_i1.p1  ORF type:complete len:213 (-),score=45.20 TRINITY_DN20_c0_g1_i1:82-720(-)